MFPLSSSLAASVMCRALSTFVFDRKRFPRLNFKITFDFPRKSAAEPDGFQRRAKMSLAFASRKSREAKRKFARSSRNLNYYTSPLLKK
jgi:hypothetical protein